MLDWLFGAAFTALPNIYEWYQENRNARLTRQAIEQRDRYIQQLQAQLEQAHNRNEELEIENLLNELENM